jgi:5-hydroxyisourate hydrolase
VETWVQAQDKPGTEFAMDINVHVTDGIHGHPAEGVGVRVTSCRGGMGDTEIEKARGRTDRDGQFRCFERITSIIKGGKYSIEIDADIYFASLGISCWQQKVALLFCVIDPGDEYEVTSVLTPFMQATYCIRRLRGSAPEYYNEHSRANEAP